MRCSEPGNIASTMALPGGVSATHGSEARTSKKMAPVRRTARSTSDKASISLSADDRARAPDEWSFARRQPIARLSALRKPSDLTRRDALMSNENTHAGSCFCGAVHFEVSGQPAAMGYCHCESCRHWSAGPVNAFSLWQPTAVKVTKGANNIGTYNKTPVSYRKWCKTCGGHVFTEHPPLKLTDVFAAMLPGLKFQA